MAIIPSQLLQISLMNVTRNDTGRERLDVLQWSTLEVQEHMCPR